MCLLSVSAPRIMHEEDTFCPPPTQYQVAASYFVVVAVVLSWLLLLLCLCCCCFGGCSSGCFCCGSSFRCNPFCGCFCPSTYTSLECSCGGGCCFDGGTSCLGEEGTFVIFQPFLTSNQVQSWAFNVTPSSVRAATVVVVVVRRGRGPKAPHEHQ